MEKKTLGPFLHVLSSVLQCSAPFWMHSWLFWLCQTGSNDRLFAYNLRSLVTSMHSMYFFQEYHLSWIKYKLGQLVSSVYLLQRTSVYKTSGHKNIWVLSSRLQGLFWSALNSFHARTILRKTAVALLHELSKQQRKDHQWNYFWRKPVSNLMWKSCFTVRCLWDLYLCAYIYICKCVCDSISNVLKVLRTSSCSLLYTSLTFHPAALFPFLKLFKSWGRSGSKIGSHWAFSGEVR